MSAPSIPNLLSLRGSSRGGRGRGRARGGGPPTGSAPSRDIIIQGTDQDAALSRKSAVDQGYLNDPFARHLVPNTPGVISRRLPIINRGTYTRTVGLDKLIDLFLSGTDGTEAHEKQIVSLGAGTDTRSLRLFASSNHRNITYHEIDFPEICAKKLRTVQITPDIRQVLQDPIAEDDGSWRSEAQNGNRLWCHGLDLRDLAQKEATAISGIRPDIPTLLISECCLCYLEVPTASAVVRWFEDQIPNLGIIIYEPIKPDDGFGRMMVSNLAARGIRMPTLEEYKTSSQQESRLRTAGFEQAQHMMVDEIWDQWVPQEEKQRVDDLEGLDEVEEWRLLAGHYIVVWGWKGQGFSSLGCKG